MQCGGEEVEQWVVKAIGAKLLEAKLDQVRRVVVVTRCTFRVFGKQQWEDLRRQLHSWVGNLAAAKQNLPQQAAPPPRPVACAPTLMHTGCPLACTPSHVTLIAV